MRKKAKDVDGFTSFHGPFLAVLAGGFPSSSTCHKSQMVMSHSFALPFVRLAILRSVCFHQLFPPLIRATCLLNFRLASSLLSPRPWRPRTSLLRTLQAERRVGKKNDKRKRNESNPLWNHRSILTKNRSLKPSRPKSASGKNNPSKKMIHTLI